MSSIDCYYTPEEIAKKMIASAKGNSISSIADFSAGNGALLKAGKQKWPKSRIIATDISSEAVSNLRSTEPEWIVERCDFLCDNARKQINALEAFKGKISLILLNPPFSCRGGTRYVIRSNDEKISCSLAFAFLITAIQYLEESGELIAILPAGSANSEKDQNAWIHLRKMGRVSIVGSNGWKAFSNCYANTILVHFRQLAIRNKSRSLSKTNELQVEKVNAIAGKNIEIIRGKVQMHTVTDFKSKESSPLIHTTELRKKIDVKKRKVGGNHKTISGPAILLPRVGKPNRDKICLYLNKFPVVLSDCVIALKGSSKQSVQETYSKILKNWSLLESSYGGTCAKYITLNALSNFLKKIGLFVK